MTKGGMYPVRTAATAFRIGWRARQILVGLWFLGVMAFAAPPAVAQVFDPKTFTLDNGLKVVVIEHHLSPVVRHMMFYRVGSADDPPGKSGLAHYLEHMMFKGTETLSPGEFSRIVARNGGSDNAFVSYDMTGYFQTIASDRLELVMGLEADRMQNLRIDPKEAIPELQVVLEERRTRTDNQPSAQLREHISAALYMHHPYRVPIIGWQHEIETLNTDDLESFYRQHYGPNNAILVIAGDVTLDEVRPLAEKYYGPIPENPDVRERVRLEEPPHRAARRIEFRSERVREPSWTRDYLAPSRASGETGYADALEMLSVILGSGATSRLYRSLVIDQKLALAAGTSYSADRLGPSSFYLSARPAAGVSMADLEAAVDAEIQKLLSDGVTEEEVENARNRLVASVVFARDSLTRGANAIGRALTTGQTLESVESWPNRVKALGPDDVVAAARHVLTPERSVTGLLLPEADDEAGPAERAGPERPSTPVTDEVE